MSDIPLAVTEQHLYLGVKSHHKLSWKSHIDYHTSVIEQAKQLAFQNDIYIHCPKHLPELAYKQFV